MASGGRMLLLQRGLLGATPNNGSRAAASALLQPQRRSIYADPQGKSYEREGLVMYVLCRDSLGWTDRSIDSIDGLMGGLHVTYPT